LQPNPAFSGNGTAFKLSYTVQAAGSSDIVCSVLGVDMDGNEIPLKVINNAYNSTATPTTIPPTATLPPTVPPPPTQTPVPSQLATVSGIAEYQNRPSNAGIKVQLLGAGDAIVAEVTTVDDGMFSFTDVPVGAYRVKFSAPQHLIRLLSASVQADGQTLDLGTQTLPAGDTNDDGKVDLTDAGLIGANFGVNAPPAPSNADLNRDAQVNIRDLALIGGNFGLNGPLESSN
jgi:hypothetical protein